MRVRLRSSRRWRPKINCEGVSTADVHVLGEPRSPQFAPGQALELLKAIARLPGHDFWPDHLPVQQAVASDLALGHRQVTDLYLIALASANGGVLATFDRPASALGHRAGADVEFDFDCRTAPKPVSRLPRAFLQPHVLTHRN